MKKYQIASLDELCKKANNDSDWFWNAVSKDIGIVWDKKYTRISDFSNGYPWARWFVDGKTNIIKSSLEKFSKISPEKIAYHFLSENYKQRSLTYRELEEKTNQMANALKKLDVQKGDVIAIYMPMIPEAIITILAAGKIGAIQTVIFSGYSSDALHVRLKDCNAKILFVSDGFSRKGKNISQKSKVLEATKQTNVKKIIVTSYKGVDDYTLSDKIDFFDNITKSESSTCETESMNSDDPLFILFTSGTTGRPKGVIHTHGGFSVFAGHQASYLIDMHSDDVLFWPADIGWITGLVWNVYGLLEVGTTGVIYDGALDWPDNNHIWEILEKFNVTIFGISPTAVRMFKKSNIEPAKKFNLKKIRNIPTTGEVIDEESWWWLFEKVGNKKIPIMNLAGGTEIGGALLSVFPGMRLKPTTVGMPCPGMNLDVVDDDGNSIKNTKGYLVVKSPWPGMTKGLLNDSKRYLKTYWSRYENIWFHGDYVLMDDDGLWYMYGRVDDVINVSGHRLSTAEIEQCVISHEKISDAASVSIPDEITGEAIVVFVTLENKLDAKKLVKQISDHVSEKIGKLAKPKHVIVLSELPKTRTGKIMRRLLRSKLLGLPLGDVSSLENPSVIDEVPKVG